MAFILSKKKEVDKKAIFLDRDGVINVRIENDYVRKWAEFEFYDGALEAIEILARKFDYCFVVTNQQGIAKGLMKEEDLILIHSNMLKSIENHGGKLDAIYYCPKHENENPHCRKPNTGMAEQAAAEFENIDFSSSVMVGDSLSDMDFGKRMNMNTVFILTKTDINQKLLNNYNDKIDLRFNSLIAYAKSL